MNLLTQKKGNLNAKDKNENSIPRMTAWFTINRSCNLRCNWCYAKMTGFNIKDSMSMETVNKCTMLFKDIGLDSVILIGGEPTIHKHFLEIIRTVTENGLKVYLVSNALKFSDPVFLKQSIKFGLKAMTVSLKASNSQDYKNFTGRDVFMQLTKAIYNIGNEEIPFVINVTVCEDLIDNFDEMIDMVDRSNARTFSVDTGKPIIIDEKTYVDGMGDPKRMAVFFMDVYPKMKKMKIRPSLKIAIPFCLFPKNFIDDLIADGNIMTGCQMARGRGIIIDPGGNLISCNHLCNVSLGRIGDDFQNKNEYVDFRKRKEVKEFYKTANSCPHELCVNCQYWPVCGAGCKLYWLHYDPKIFIKGF